MSHFYGTVTIAASTRAFADVGRGGLSGVLIGNESGLTVTVTLQGANTSRSLYPGTVDWFPIPKGANFNGIVQFDPVANLNNASSWPSSYVQIDTFGPGEMPTGTYPMALPRNTNVGNTVPTTGGGSTTLQNDNNAANTTVIESTQTGSSGSNLFADNSGNFYLAQWISSTYTKLFQVIANGASVVKLGATGLLSEVLGSFKIDQNLTVLGTSSLDNAGITTDGSGNVSKVGTIASGAITSSGAISGTAITGTSMASSGHIDVTTNNTTLRMKDNGGTLRDVIYVDASNGTDVQAAALNGAINLKNQDGTNYLIIGSGKIGITSAADIIDASSPTAVYFKCRNSSGSINFQMPDGNTIVSFDSTGINASNGVNYNVGRIKDFNNGTISASGTVNHGLSGTPNAVWMCPDSGSSTWTFGASTYTSTQFTATISSALTTKWLAYR